MNKGGLGPPFVVLGRVALCGGLVLSPACVDAWAQPVAVVVYRCPGPPVLYTDALTAPQAQAQHCRPIEGTPLNAGAAPVRSLSRPKAASASLSSASQASTAASVPAPEALALQREREGQALRILQTELAREEQRLEALRVEFNQGQPERRSDEKNAVKYQGRVDALRAALVRKEADIAALKREIGLRSAR